MKTPRIQKNTGVFIACLTAVFYMVFGVIRMTENPHKYWPFESLLAFFECCLWCNTSGDKNKF